MHPIGRSINKHCPQGTSHACPSAVLGRRREPRETGNGGHSHAARSGSAAEAALIVCTFDVQVEGLTIPRTEGVEARSENREGEVWKRWQGLAAARSARPQNCAITVETIRRVISPFRNRTAVG